MVASTATVYNRLKKIKSKSIHFLERIWENSLSSYHYSRQSKDLNALRCQEKQKQKLLDMIKFALNEVGCEELPPGDDLPNFLGFEHGGYNNDNHQV